MPAESIFDPIPKEAIRQARARLALEGLSVEDWARREGFEAKTVYNVLSGRRMAIRGLSLRIAIRLGLRPDPEAPIDHGPAASPIRTLPLKGRIGSCERSSGLQAGGVQAGGVQPGPGSERRSGGLALGEPVR